MSTIHHQPPGQAQPDAGAEDDPFRYGRRYVPLARPDDDGDVDVEYEEVPLPLEGLLFPEEGDRPVLTRWHVATCRYLADVLEFRLAGAPDSLVTFDMRIDYKTPGLRPLGPDLAIFFGEFDPRINEPDGPATLDAGVPGVERLMAIEVTSPDTRINDIGIKVKYYERAGIPYYVIVDGRLSGRSQWPRRVKLLGYRLRDPVGYERIPLDEMGRLWLEPLGVWLKVAPGNDVVCVEGATGEPIAPALEQHQGRLVAEAQAAEARTRAAEAEAQVAHEARARAEAQTQAAEAQTRAAEAEAQVAHEARARAEAQTQAAEAQAQAAEAQTRAAEAQAQAAKDARLRAEFEVRVQALEAELRRLRGEG